MRVLNCICTKWGDRYPAIYANRLFRSIKQHSTLPVRFICISDTGKGLDDAIDFIPLVRLPFQDQMEAAQKTTYKTGAPLRKVIAFQPGLIPNLSGPALMLDLDILVTGDLADLAKFAPGKVAMRRPFAQNKLAKTYGEGSVTKFEPGLHDFLYTSMADDPFNAVQACFGSEQSHTSGVAMRRGQLSHFPDDWVCSFKKHCRPARPLNLLLPPRQPKQARVICFHGRPSIEEARDGFTDTKLFKRTRRAAWVGENWQ